MLVIFPFSGSQRSILRGANYFVRILAFFGTQVGKPNPDTDTHDTVAHII